MNGKNELNEQGENMSSSTMSQKADSSRQLRVFLCHSSSDKPAVRELYRRLRSDGFDPWLDEEKLLPGQDWQKEIPDAVRRSDIVLVCLSKGTANKSGYIQKEIRYALDIADEQPEGTIFIIPVRLEESDIPERLARWQWVNLFEEKGYNRLVDALRTRAEEIGVKLASHHRDELWYQVHRELRLIDSGFEESSDTQKLFFHIINRGGKYMQVRKVRFQHHSLPKISFPSSYLEENTYTIIPVTQDKCSIAPGGRLVIEVPLRQKWQRSDIEQIKGEWGFLVLDVDYDKTQVDGILFQT